MSAEQVLVDRTPSPFNETFFQNLFENDQAKRQRTAHNACLLVEQERRKKGVHRTEEDIIRLDYLVRRANRYISFVPEVYGDFRYCVDTNGIISTYYLR